MKYQITVTEDQERVLQEALDLYARLLCDQFGEIRSLLVRHGGTFTPGTLLKIKRSLEDGCVAGPGIVNPEVPEVARTAYDMWQALEYKRKVAEQRKAGQAVDVSDPDFVGKTPPPEILTMPDWMSV